MPARELLSVDEEARIVDAITLAEKNSSGEIRVHIEFKCSGDPLKRAEKLFLKLDMDRTERRNGVLLYIATKDRKVAVFGDAGITEVVGDHFWQDEVDSLIRYFRDGKFEEGIAVVVSDIGEKLKQFFPAEKVDPNELDNSLSYNDNRDDGKPAGTPDTESTAIGDYPSDKSLHPPNRESTVPGDNTSGKKDDETGTSDETEKRDD